MSVAGGRRNRSGRRLANSALPFLAAVAAAAAGWCPVGEPRVILGNEVLRRTAFSQLAGERVAVLTNPSGLFPDTLQHIVDHLHFGTNVTVSAVLAPEHGFRGDHQAESGDPDSYIDTATNLTVYSVYRKNQSDIQRVLRETNTSLLLVDIQDVGTRLYTFVWTMFDVLDAIAAATPSPLAEDVQQPAASGGAVVAPAPTPAAAVKVVVLDRPNPVGGLQVEGPVLNVSCCSSRYGKAPVTHRHGLTVGELALLFDGVSFNGTLARAQTLTVVHMENWVRAMLWDDTGLPWILPSPNLPTAASSLFYLSTVFIEATTVSEATLNDALGCGASTSLDACFRAAYYTPTFFKFNNTMVSGTQWLRLDAVTAAGPAASVVVTAPPSLLAAPRLQNNSSPSLLAAAAIVRALQRLSPAGQWAWDGSWFGTPGPRLMDLYSGTPELRLALDDVQAFPTALDVVAHFDADVRAFTAARQPYLLY